MIEEILDEIIYPAFEEARSQFNDEGVILNQMDTVLFGHKAVLDSMAMVAMILDIEELIEEKYGKPLTLANDQTMSRSKSPFRTIGTLAEYIEFLLKETSNVK